MDRNNFRDFEGNHMGRQPLRRGIPNRDIPANEQLGCPGGLGREHFMSHLRMSHGQKGLLRPTVLHLLEFEPLNGIELMNKISRGGRGWFKPSPGTIYPLLKSLCEEKLIKKRVDGKYEITEKYKEEFNNPEEDIEGIISDIDGNISYLEELKETNKSKLNKYKERLDEILKRLSKLK